jgi:hypothetical protein
VWVGGVALWFMGTSPNARCATRIGWRDVVEKVKKVKLKNLASPRWRSCESHWMGSDISTLEIGKVEKDEIFATR